MRPVRVALLVGGVHLALSFVGGIITLGAAFGAHRPWANSVGEQLVMAVTVVLLFPLSLLNFVLSRNVAPGYPVVGVMLTSALSCLVAFGIAWWRQSRGSTPISPATCRMLQLTRLLS